MNNDVNKSVVLNLIVFILFFNNIRKGNNNISGNENGKFNNRIVIVELIGEKTINPKRKNFISTYLSFVTMITINDLIFSCSKFLWH